MEEWPCQDGRFLRSGFYTLDSVHVCRFDIITFDFTGPEDESGILQSRENVNKLIEQEINEDIPSSRVVVGGFSQGGSMTLVTGLTSPHRLAGLAVLSGWLAIRGKVKEVWMLVSHQRLRGLTRLWQLLGQPATATPIFWGHGVEDPLVPLAIGQFSKRELENVGVKEAEESGKPGVFFKGYPGLGHSTDMQEINDWAYWLKKVIPPA